MVVHFNDTISIQWADRAERNVSGLKLLAAMGQDNVKGHADAGNVHLMLLTPIADSTTTGPLLCRFVNGPPVTSSIRT